MWRMVGASVPGEYHKKKNLLCQDAYLYQVIAADTSILTVADGAGCATCSREGAKLAVKQATHSLVKLLKQYRLPQNEADWRKVMERVFYDVIKALEDNAANKGRPLQDYATTLTCVVAFANGLAVGQIGDGVVVAENSAGDLFLAIRPQRGEYANQSAFVTMPRGLEHLSINVSWEPVNAVVVTTDGLLRLALKLPEHLPHLQFFKPLLSFVAETENEKEAQHQLMVFLGSERVCARTDDDRTLVLAVHSPDAAAECMAMPRAKVIVGDGR